MYELYNTQIQEISSRVLVRWIKCVLLMSMQRTATKHVFITVVSRKKITESHWQWREIR